MWFIIYAVIAVVALIVAIVEAKEFEAIAGEKGYTGYFWWCFLLGPVGWAMVIALPDRGKKDPDYTELLKKIADSASSPAPSSVPEPDDSLPEL